MNKINIRKGGKVNLPHETIYESGIRGPVGITLASIRESEPHFHKKTTEWYLVAKGSGIANLDGKKIILRLYDVLKIPPKTIHSVKGNIELWVITRPPWKKEDYYKVGKK
ncbi:MAG: cupin domain-containing protein [Candidatus Aenigmarchaeota archaeon]|nr:cupin domain-containing protein [Candidatus Aenigmarchaeota archaeon]